MIQLEAVARIKFASSGITITIFQTQQFIYGQVATSDIHIKTPLNFILSKHFSRTSGIALPF